MVTHELRADASGQPGCGPEVLLLNGFEVVQGSRTVALAMGSQRLLAYLALQSHPIQRVHVAGTLWGDAPESRSLANLRSTLWRLHDTDLRVVQSVGAGLRLEPDVGVDLRSSTRLAR